MTETIRLGALAAAASTSRITVARAEAAPAEINTVADELSAVAAMLEMPELDELGSFDVVCIACFGDPGLAELRERTGKPVIGLAQAALNFAAATYGSFGVLAASVDAIAIMEELVDRYGLGDYCRGVVAIGADVGEVATDINKYVPVMASRCDQLVVVNNAASVCLGCSAIGSAAAELTEISKTPVLDAIPIMVRFAEMAGER